MTQEILSVFFDDTPEQIATYGDLTISEEVNEARRTVWEYMLSRYDHTNTDADYAAALCYVARSLLVEIEGVEPFTYNSLDYNYRFANEQLLYCNGMIDTATYVVDVIWWASAHFYNDAVADTAYALVLEELSNADVEDTTYLFLWMRVLEYYRANNLVTTRLY